MNEAPFLMTVKEVATLLRLSQKGVYSMVEARRIPFVRVSNRVRFVQADVLMWLRGNQVPASEK
jgi:excisionase family DNA binding protein